MSDDRPAFRLPRDDEHTTVVGHNGSGKTQLGAWLLSQQNLRDKPWYVVDYKGDELLNGISRAREIDFHETPRQPGLYMLHSRPDLEDETEGWLWNVWQNEGAGLYIDEGYMLPQANRGAYQAILTQGRSKRIPVITLSQRPVKVSRFAFSEASHIAMFDLTDRRDRATIEEICPRGFSQWCPRQFGRQLPKYHARWYNVKERAPFVLLPVPDADTIISDIDGQLEPKVKWL